VVVSRGAILRVSLGASPSQIEDSVNKIKDVDLLMTLTMFPYNENKIKKGDSSSSNLVMYRANELSVDLEEEDKQGGHKDLTFPVPKVNRVYKGKIKYVAVVRRTSNPLRSKEVLKERECLE
jgi:hypothetical protein